MSSDALKCNRFTRYINGTLQEIGRTLRRGLGFDVLMHIYETRHEDEERYKDL